MAYSFSTYPTAGYSTLPDVFWSWTQENANSVRQGPHRSIVGGPSQWALFAREQDALWDKEFMGDYAREILIALQPIGGHRDDWEALARTIETSPPNWRWWIRRHPASRPDQDIEFGRLLSFVGANIKIAEASCLPLPILLRRMSVVLSLASGAAFEAAMLGVPVLFLSEGAEGPFGDLIADGRATVIATDQLIDRIEQLARQPTLTAYSFPNLDDVLDQLDNLPCDHSEDHDFSGNDVNDGAMDCAKKVKTV